MQIAIGELEIQAAKGAMTHEDFEGHKGTIKAGDLQWMTAGRGIVHSKIPAGPGANKGLQLWINLSSKNKIFVQAEADCNAAIKIDKKMRIIVVH